MQPMNPPVMMAAPVMAYPAPQAPPQPQIVINNSKGSAPVEYVMERKCTCWTCIVCLFCLPGLCCDCAWDKKMVAKPVPLAK